MVCNQVFLFIDDCLEAVFRLMDSPYSLPINIGSEEMVSINKLVEIVCEVAEKYKYKHIDGPLGVRGRNQTMTSSENNSIGITNILLKKEFPLLMNG